MNKKLGIVTLSADVGQHYKSQLSHIFGEGVDITSYSFENSDLDNMECIREMRSLDIILISTHSQYEILKNYLGSDFNVVITKLTLSKKGYKVLKGLKNLDSAMLVNLSLEMAIETIGLLYKLGIDYIKFTPVYPNMDKVPDIDVAITTGETRYIPKDVKKVYDLGHRLIDEMTIIELFIGLGLEEELTNKRVTDYFGELMSYNMGVEYLLGKSNVLRNQLDTLLSLMDKGLIYINREGVIVSCNGSVEKIIKINGSQMIGKSAKVVLPQIDFYNNNIKNKLLKINDEYITVSIYRVNGDGENFNGSYAIIEDFESMEKAQNELRLQLMNKGHIARYDINNIVGESKAIREVKDLIKRMAPSNSPVLITGESGTGKELVAQAIHNLSNNKNRHFIAVNCAAFNPSLLESELFGYEGGAFTGAMKEGKKGIFEIANNGTLFLDEIGEMSTELQVKLLRVIQEGEIMRVGGNEIIKVNLRIIAATNIDLDKQMENGKFRKDLYYRLNVLPINIPPLRERQEDIGLLFDHLVGVNKYNFALDQDAKQVLKNHNWDGNIRELINCILYLENLGKPLVKAEDLPYHIKNALNRTVKKTTYDAALDNDEDRVVLEILYEAFLSKTRLGRRSISDQAYESNYHISEYDVKRILDELSQKGLVNVSIGRGGTTISKKGIELIKGHNRVNGI